MLSFLAIVGVFLCGFAAGWAQGSKDGFRHAVDQLEKIIRQVERRR